jgi:hypothetical protein
VAYLPPHFFEKFLINYLFFIIIIVLAGMKGESPFTLIGFLEVNYLLIVELIDALFLLSLEVIKG